MTTTAYKPGARPTELLANLIDSYWDTRDGNIPKPTIIEKPYADAQRIDLRNTGDHCIISLGGTTENFITLGFQHRTFEANMTIELNTFTSRERMYDHMEEIRRILFAKRLFPSDFLLDGFEGYANSAAVNAVWGDTTSNSTLSLLTSARKYGANSMRVVVGAGGAGEAYRAFPSTFTVKPYPQRLQQIKFFGKIDSSSDVIGVTLRDASNRSGLSRTWNVTIDSTDFTEKVINIDAAASSSVGTWDPTLIDELAFTSLAANRTFDIDHIDLSTKEFQFFQYQSFREDINNFQYWSSELRGLYRTHGEAVSELA